MGTRRSQGPRSPGRTLATHSCATSLSSPRVLQVFPVGSSSSLGCSHTSRTRTRSRPARCHSRLRLGTRSNSRGYNCDWPPFAYPHDTRHRTYTTPYHPALSPSHISESQNLHYQYITSFRILSYCCPYPKHQTTETPSFVPYFLDLSYHPSIYLLSMLHFFFFSTFFSHIVLVTLSLLAPRCSTLR
jgi:hypothetical protein